MTHIATTAIKGATTIGAAKAPGMKAGAGGDFAALVAGLGAGGDEAGTLDADGLVITGDTPSDADADAGTGEGKPGEPVVLDLGLGAAAQNAMADMVVTPPMPVAVPSPAKATSEGDATAALAALAPATATDGRGVAMVRARAARMEGTAGAEAVPGQATEALAESTKATESTATNAGAATPIPSVRIPARFALPADRAPTAAGAAPMVANATMAAGNAALPQVAPTPVDAPAIAVTAGAVLKDASPAAAPGAVDDAVRRAIAAAARQGGGEAVVADAAMPLAPQMAAPVAGETVRTPASDRAAAPADTAVSAEEAVAAQASTGYAAIQPVISSLHRAGPAAGARSGEPVPMAPIPGDQARRDPSTASDGSSGSDTGGPSLASDDPRSAAAATDAPTGGRQFAEIIQGLPPIAQSRIGAVSDATAVTAGPADVGATLQGQVIDMGVGGQWIDRMAKEITALAEGNGHSRFQLSPPNLGRIQIDVWQGEGGGRVQLLTETDEAARQLRDGQSSLQSDARLAALQLNSITIDRAATAFDTPSDQNGQQQQQPSRQDRPGSDQASQSGQASTQSSTSGGSQQNSQQNAQAALQSGMNGGNSNGQGKSSPRRDVLNQQSAIVNQQGNGTGRDGDRLVRYA